MGIQVICEILKDVDEVDNEILLEDVWIMKETLGIAEFESMNHCIKLFFAKFEVHKN